MIVGTERFTWDLLNLSYIAEASDLGLGPGQVVSEIELQHENTVMYFMLDKTERDEEDDVLSWEYRPTRATLAKYPAMKAVRVIILND